MSTPGNTRRDFLKAVGLTAASLALPSRLSAGQTSGDKPNVLFIVIDDLNDWIGSLGGHPDALTPNLDRLAARSMLFENAYCPAPMCMPSRTAVLSGIRPSTSGVYGNHDKWEASEVLKNAAAIPEHFRTHGYRTMTVGKVFHSPLQKRFWNKMWDEDGGYGGGYRPWPKKYHFEDVEVVAKKFFDWEALDGPDNQMPDIRHTDWAIERLNQKRDKPFFLALGLYRPHLPWTAPKRFFEMYDREKITLPIVNENDLDDVPPIARQIALYNGMRQSDHKVITERGLWPDMVRAYLACTSFVDYCVGQVIDALQRSSYAENTIVCLWSDHGWHLGEKLHWRKFALWEETTRSVLMFSAPGATKPGSRTENPVSLLDIYPTLVDMCELPKPKELEGVSLTPLMKDPNSVWDRPALTTYMRNNHSLRSRRWRYTRYEDGTEELYDHDNDPYEWTNLAEQPQYAQTKRKLAKWLPKVNVRAVLQPLRKDTFYLKQGDVIAPNRELMIAARPFRVTATINSNNKNGVILAHGDSNIGYALYIRDGRLAMEINQPLKWNRWESKRTIVIATQKIPSGQVSVTAMLGIDGRVALEVSGAEVASGKAQGPILLGPTVYFSPFLFSLPGKLVVGNDTEGVIADYKGPKKFSGTISDVVLKIGD